MSLSSRSPFLIFSQKKIMNALKQNQLVPYGTYDKKTHSKWCGGWGF